MLSRLPFRLPRLQFRLLAKADLPKFHEYRNDVDVARYQGWSPMSRAEAERFIEEHAGSAELTPGSWRQLAIARRDDDALVGDLGLWLSPDSSEAEFGLTLAPEVQGQGLGTETVRGILDLLFEATQVGLVTASTDSRNLPCVRTLTTAGMIRVDTRPAEYKGETCIEHVFHARRPGGEP